MPEATVLRWTGNVDVAAVERIRADLDGAVASARAPEAGGLLLDLSSAGHLDSMALGMLVHARNLCLAAGVALTVRGISPSGRRLVAMSGLSSLFHFEETAAGGDEAHLSRLPAAPVMPAAPDPMFDQIAALVRRVIDVPTALVSLVDRTAQVFPGAVGLPDPWQDTRCTPLSHSFCQYVVADGAALVVADARTDPRLAGNGAIDDLGVIAYAGMPITDVDGTVVGSLCAIDSTPREWSGLELRNLADLADACSSELHKRGSARQVAVAADRERIAHEMHQRVIGQLFGATMTLGQVRASTTGAVDTLVAGAVDTIDAAITTIRTTIFQADRPDIAS